MTKAKSSVIDSDHEIEEFLQEYIVEKVKSGYEASTTIIRDSMSEIAEIIKTVKNSSNVTNQDIAVLIKNDDAMLDDIGEIVESINKMIETVIKSQTEIKGIIPNDGKIIETLSIKWAVTISEKLDPIQADMTKLLADVTELGEGIAVLSEEIRTLPNVDELLQEKYTLISGELLKLEELLNCQHEKISATIAQVNDKVTEKNDELLKNNSIIVKGIGDVNQKIKWLWITVGVDTVLIVGLFVALLCR